MSTTTAGRVIIWLLSIGLAVVAITPLCFSVPVPKNNPFARFEQLTSPLTLCLNYLEMSWLIFNAGLVLLVASINVVFGWWVMSLRGSTPKHSYWNRLLSSRMMPLKFLRASSGASIIKLAQRYGYSMGEIAALLLWAAYNVTSLAVPLKHYDVHNPYWLSSAPAGASKPTTAALWVYAVGSMAAWPCMGNFFLAFVTAVRSSFVLDLLGFAQQDMMWFHKLTSRAAIFWLTIHGVFCQIPMMSVSTYLFAWQNWYPTNPTGFFNWSGNIAWILCLIILSSSYVIVRYRAYQAFRFLHYLLWPVVMFSVWHYSVSFFYFQAGLILYTVDLLHRWVLKSTRTTAHLSSVSGNTGGKGNCTVVDVKVGKYYEAGSTVFVCFPSLSPFQYHAMSIASSTATSFRLVIQADGDWTEQLFSLASTSNGDVQAIEQTIIVEGPYTDRVCEDVIHQLSQGDSVLLMAGGSGITALLPALDAAVKEATSGKHHLPHLKGMMLLWAVRSTKMVKALMPSLSTAALQGARVDIHVTAVEAKHNASEDLEKAEEVTPISHHVPSYGQQVQTPNTSTGAPDTSDGFHSNRPTLLPQIASFILILLAVAGSVGGFVFGSWLSCASSMTPNDPRWAPMEAAYNASVINALGGPDVPWPEAQMTFESMPPYVCRLRGQADNIGDYCSVESVDVRTMWPTKVQPGGKCQSVFRCWVVPFFMYIFFSCLFMILCPLAGALCIVRSSWYSLTTTTVSCNSNAPDFKPATLPTAPQPADASEKALETHQGRPDLRTAVDSAVARAQQQGASVLHVYQCGPKSMRGPVHKAVVEQSSASVRVVVHNLNWQA